MATTHIFNDPEFGEIVIRRDTRARAVRMHVGTDGRIVVSAPRLMPLAMVRTTINSSRESLRALTEQTPRASVYFDGQQIGRSHTLAVVATNMVKEPTARIERSRLLVLLPDGAQLADPRVQQQVRDTVVKILRREAKSYLAHRLKQLAVQHNASYERVRLTHSGGRWGSCSSTGTISLNIALMKLPDPLIDYVIAHELAHTRQMNHSTLFWEEVARMDPLYKLHRQQLKQHSPIV